MNGGCRKLATEKVPRGGLQGDLAANSYRKSRPTWAGRHGHPPRTKKNPCSAALGRWREGSKGTSDSEECAREGVGGCTPEIAQPPGRSTVPFPEEPGKPPASQEGGPELCWSFSGRSEPSGTLWGV